MNTIEELEAARRAASDEYRRLKGIRDGRISDAISEVRERITGECAPRMDEAGRALAAAESALKDAKDAPSPRRAAAKLPIGAQFEEWRYPAFGRAPKRTGRKAVVELWTKDMKPPDNVRYGVPKIGDTILRVLKKDGTPSKNYERVMRQGDVPGGWRLAASGS